MSYLGLGTRDRVWSEKSQLCVLWTVEIAWIALNGWDRMDRSQLTWDLGLGTVCEAALLEKCRRFGLQRLHFLVLAKWRRDELGAWIGRVESRLPQVKMFTARISCIALLPLWLRCRSCFLNTIILILSYYLAHLIDPCGVWLCRLFSVMTQADLLGRLIWGGSQRKTLKLVSNTHEECIEIKLWCCVFLIDLQAESCDAGCVGSRRGGSIFTPVGKLSEVGHRRSSK